jgi:hypothetical protein
MDEALARYFLDEAEGQSTLQRAPVYRSLVRGSLKNAIIGEFSRTADVLGEEGFETLVERFLDAGGPSTSLYRDIPGDFVGWAFESEHPLADLIQWEWLEIVAARHPADLDAIDPIEEDLVRPNATMQIALYERPVDEIDAETPEPDPFDTPTAYLVWRRPRTDEIESEWVGMLIARALALASESPGTVEALASRIAGEVPGLEAQAIARALDETCRALRARDGIL